MPLQQEPKCVNSINNIDNIDNIIKDVDNNNNDDDDDEIRTQPQILEGYNDRIDNNHSPLVIGIKRDINMLSNSGNIFSPPSSLLRDNNDNNDNTNGDQSSSLLKKNKHLKLSNTTSTTTTISKSVSVIDNTTTAAATTTKIPSTSSPLPFSETRSSVQSIIALSNTSSLQQQQQQQQMMHKQQEEEQRQQHNHAEQHQHDDDVLQKRSSSSSSSSSSSKSGNNNNNNNNNKYYHKSCRRYSISLKEPLSKLYLDNYYSHRVSYACSNHSNSNIRDGPFHLPELPSIPQEMLKGYRIIKGLRYSLLNDEQILSISNNNKSDIYKCNYMADIERILQKRDALHCLSRY